MREELSPFVFSSLVDYLNAIRKQFGPRGKPMNLKNWATKLGYKSSRSLELILSGDRLPSEDFLYRLGRERKLSEKEKAYLSLMVRLEKNILKKKTVHDIEFEMNKIRPDRFEACYIDNKIFRRVSEWYPLVIRQLAMTTKFKNDIQWIAKKLRGKLTSSQIASALAEWERLAFERKVLYTAEDIPSSAVRIYHKKILQKGIEAIDEIGVDQREFMAITFRASKEDIPKMKKILRETRDQLNKELSQDNGTDVFQLCLGLFPHTDLKD